MPSSSVLRCVFLTLLLASTIQASEDIPFRITASQNTHELTPFDVFELTFEHPNHYANPFHEVTVDVTFQSPSGKQVPIGGFHYGSLQPPTIKVPPVTGRGRPVYEFADQSVWKARFAPSEIGTWHYSYTFTNRDHRQATGMGTFRVVEGRRSHPGFLRRHRSNPFRWVHDDGSPFYGVGLQECLGDPTGTGSALAAMSMEGPFRTDRTDLLELLPGPLYVRGPSMNPMNADVYFRRYAACGFNLFRMSQRNCSYDLYRDLDHYLVQEGVMTDEILRHVRKYGCRVMYGLFGYQKVFNDHPDDAEAMAKIKRFIKYSVDRWGAYVDVWEFLNEQKAADGWYAQMTPYLRSIDPYDHPITTSWERPELPGIEVNAPHWYGNEDERQSDIVTESRAKGWKKHNLPVIVGEQGNSAGRRKDRAPGVGGVWAVCGTPARHAECACGCGQRCSLTAPDFTVDLALLITPDGPPDIDRDGIPNDRDVDDDNDGTNDDQDAFPLEPEEWEDRDHDLIGDNLDADIDGDGQGDDRNANGTPDHEEMDLDGDGVPRGNAVPWDAFPRDPKEQRDTDGDGIGDNADLDDDGDGFSDADERQAQTDPLDSLSFPVQ